MANLENNPALISWEELEKKYFTPEEIVQSKLYAAIMCEFTDARNEGVITQQQLEEISDALDAEMEKSEDGSFPLDKALKYLFSLGKTLAVVPLEKNNAN